MSEFTIHFPLWVAALVVCKLDRAIACIAIALKRSAARDMWPNRK